MQWTAPQNALRVHGFCALQMPALLSPKSYLCSDPVTPVVKACWVNN